VSISAKGKMRSSKSEVSSLGFERRQLAQTLRKTASERYPHNITFEFDMKCLGGNLDDGKVTFQTSKSPKLQTREFDLLIGADGQNSRVRALLEDQVCYFLSGTHESRLCREIRCAAASDELLDCSAQHLLEVF
jgi:2-polyprenyl-6-methoxyphenol hydroxylase-like FAD-dependent oxidoreductase